MPCFLKVMVGSNSVAEASSLRPGPESCTSISTRSPSPRVSTSDRAAGPGRLGGILQEVGQDPVHQVRARVHARTAVVEPEMIRHFGMHGPQQRDALGHERVDVEHFGMHRRLAGELRECAHAPLERRRSR